MNMEITGLDKGVFIEYKPSHLTSDGEIEFNVVNIDRDSSWFSNVYPTLENFWNEVRYYQEKGIETHPEYDYFVVKSKPKIKNRAKSVWCDGLSSDDDDDSL